MAQMKAETLMELMKQHFETDEGKELCKKVNLIYQINIAPKKIGIDEASYTVDLKKGVVTKGTVEGVRPDATFSFKDEDFVKIALGKMNPQIAFMRGRIEGQGQPECCTEIYT